MSNYWYDDAIFYNLYPLGACNRKHDNDYTLSTEGLDRMGDWVEHMAAIGCNAVYLGPIFESGTHGYDTTDYRKLDSRLGTNEQFAAFVESCHRHDIRVVVDGVFNHTGRDFFAFRDLKANREASPYRDWYRQVNFGGNNPLNDGFSYEAWRGHWELARLNPHNPAVRDYLFDTVRGWVSEFDIDGIRLDCADCLDFGFMRELRSVCTTAKADFWLMGEIIHGDYTQWANPGTLHSVTNYECAKGLYSSHNDGNMHEIAHSLGRQFGPGGLYKGLMLYNFADNHDVNRLADTVKDKRHLPTIYTILYTMPGLPSVYYGSEWGIGGVTDRVTDWNLRPYIDIRSVHKDDPALMAHITALAGVRMGSAAIRRGDYEQLAVTSHQLAFRRGVDGEQAIVMVNCAGQPAELSVSAAGTALCDRLSGERFPVSGGRVTVKLAPYGSRILCTADSAGKPAQATQAGWSQPAAAPAMDAPKPEVAPPPAEPKQYAPPIPQAAGGGITITREENTPEEFDNEHPAYEHRERKLAQGEKCELTVYSLAPGKSVCPYHYHLAREEIFYILEGQGLLRTPQGEKQVRAGDVIFFPASGQGAHRLINNHHQTLRYLDFGAFSRPDVVYYPDSGKIGADRHYFRLQDEVGYFDGD